MQSCIVFESKHSWHFALQNADDNSYPPGVVPALEFLLLPDAVAAVNNETGFSAEGAVAESLECFFNKTEGMGNQ